MAFFPSPVDSECCEDPCTKKEDACDPCGCPCEISNITDASGGRASHVTIIGLELVQVESDDTDYGCTKQYYVPQTKSREKINWDECNVGKNPSSPLVYYDTDYDLWRYSGYFKPESDCTDSDSGSIVGYYEDDSGIKKAYVGKCSNGNTVFFDSWIANYNCDACDHTVTRNCERLELSEAECADGLPLCADVENPCGESAICDKPCCDGSQPVCGSGTAGSGVQGSGTTGSGCCQETNDCCPTNPCCPPGSVPCGGAPCCGSGTANAPTCGSGTAGSGTQTSGCCTETNDCNPPDCCDDPPDCDCEQCYDGGPCEEVYCNEELETECDSNNFEEPESKVNC